MRAFLVRIGVDQAYGGWNAPVDPNTYQFVYVPIPDSPAKRYSPGCRHRFSELAAPLNDFAERFGANGLRLPTDLGDRVMHLDPDFQYLSYGDNGVRRGAGIASLQPDDLLVFYAGLRSIFVPRKLVYGLVGLFVVDRVDHAVNVPVKRRPENAHTRWTPISENDVIVQGKAKLSGRFDRCISIGEWRNRAYRVRPEIEKAWGGLSVKDGYIQRSGIPPSFLNAEQFYRWFREQRITLSQRNN